MKVTKEHYNEIKQGIANLPRDEVLKHKALKLGFDDKAKRFRWDLFGMASLSMDTLFELCHNYYDGHIDKALQKIVKELEYN